MRQQLETAIRLSLAAQVRNRLAWILLVAFVPVWYLLIGSMIRTWAPGSGCGPPAPASLWTATTSP